MSQTRVIAFNYILKNSQGDLLDASEPSQPLPFMEGKQQIIPALEAIMVKMNEGDKQNVKLAAKDAYGEFRLDMIMEVPKEELAHIKLELGSHLQLQMVVGISPEGVRLDGNHPLAGVDLIFDVEIVLIRQATAEELQHGHAHGLHGHAHHH